MRSWLGVTLVLAVLALGWAAWSRLEPGDEGGAPATLTPRLVRLFGEPSPSIGRLTAGPARAPGEPRPRAVSSFAGDPSLLLEAELDRAARTRGSAEDLHSLGLLRTFEGRFEEAVEVLRAARLEAPEDAGVASDLASAYLGAAAAADGDTVHVLLAAEAAARAVALDPDLSGARYNLALAVDRLVLRRRGRRAWEEYLELDASSDWARIARQRVADLNRPTIVDTWVGLAETLDEPGVPSLDGEVRGQVSRFPSLAREFVEERLLPRWARAVGEGRARNAEALLALAEEIGAELAAAGDGMVRGETRAIRNALRSEDGELLADLAEAHLDLGRGLALSRRHASREAESLLAAAEPHLRRAGSPLADHAAFRRAVGLRSRDLQASRGVLVGILERSGREPYPTLLGRVEWMLGLTFADQGDYATALTWYESAARRFTEAQDDVGLGGIQALIVEAHRKLGQPAAAWRARLAGLAALGRIGEPSALVRTLEEAVTALAQEDRVELGLLFHEEHLAQAAAWEGSTTAVPTALWKRAALLARAGDVPGALADLAEAERLLEASPDARARAWVQAEIEAIRGELLVGRAPQEAHRLLARAIEHSERVGHGTKLPALLHHRARAALGLGDSSAAAGDLHRALRLAEERRTSPASEALRISFFETFQATYDAMVSFQATELRDAPTALLYADMARGRALLDRLSARSATPGEAGLVSQPGSGLPSGEPFVRRLRATLPSSTTLVEFASLPERTLVWIVGERGFEMVELPLSAARLEREVKLLRSALQQGASPPRIERSASSLFEELIRPILPALGGGDRILLVPDRFLYGLPFGALFDAESGRYWAEDRELALVPSAGHLLVGGRGDPSPARARTALVVADPDFDRERFPHLSSLPGAGEEARTIARLYRRSDLLTGAEASAENVLGMMARHPVLHLGTHAVANGSDPSKSVLLLTAAPGEPGHGTLGLEGIDGADLRGVEVAFLSACTTVSPFPDGRREGLAGLARGFLAAGVPTVVGALWDVDDRSASAVALDFHRALAAGADPLSALRGAQLASLESDDDRRSSPTAWAVFQVYSTRPGPPR